MSNVFGRDLMFVDINPKSTNYKKQTPGKIYNFFALIRRKEREELISILQCHELVRYVENLRPITLANLITDYSIKENAKLFLELD